MNFLKFFTLFASLSASIKINKGINARNSHLRNSARSVKTGDILSNLVLQKYLGNDPKPLMAVIGKMKLKQTPKHQRNRLTRFRNHQRFNLKIRNS